MKDETVYKEWEDRMERAATTASSLEAEFEVASKQSNDPPLSRVNILRSGEDNMKLKELMQTAAANTLDSREVQINATIDGKVKLVSEASIRRHLKLEDSDGITTLPNTEIFEQLTLMGVKDQQSQQETKVPQPNSPTYTNVADEAAFISLDVVHGGAATTISSIDAG
ncbi:hypothetical protein Tco_0594692 [Tanacetum coccineum]